MKEGAPVIKNGQTMGLKDLKPGDRVRLKYTREGNRLIGLEVRTR